MTADCDTKAWGSTYLMRRKIYWLSRLRAKTKSTFAGLITDIQFGTILGFYALLYLVIGFVNGLFEQLYFDEDIKLPLFLISVSEFLYGIIIY